jgi:hypothetical protein
MHVENIKVKLTEQYWPDIGKRVPKFGHGQN